MSHSITILTACDWERSPEPSFAHSSLDFVTEHFRTPLESAGVDVSLVCKEWDDMVEHAKTYLDLATQDYRAVWWKLFRSIDAKSWTNVLAVTELLFCLPAANG